MNTHLGAAPDAVTRSAVHSIVLRATSGAELKVANTTSPIVIRIPLTAAADGDDDADGGACGAAAEAGSGADACDCAEQRYCLSSFGHGSCVGGRCECAAGWGGADCSELTRCMWWDVPNAAWSDAGCETVEAPAGANDTGAALYCNCTHLTDFGGIQIPTSGDEFIEEIEAITFNTFTLDEAARALANFDAAANPEITIAVFSLAGLNVLGLLFGCWRGHRRELNRRREVRRRHQLKRMASRTFETLRGSMVHVGRRSTVGVVTSASGRDGSPASGRGSQYRSSRGGSNRSPPKVQRRVSVPLVAAQGAITEAGEANTFIQERVPIGLLPPVGERVRILQRRPPPLAARAAADCGRAGDGLDGDRRAADCVVAVRQARAAAARDGSVARVVAVADGALRRGAVAGVVAVARDVARPVTGPLAG